MNDNSEVSRRGHSQVSRRRFLGTGLGAAGAALVSTGRARADSHGGELRVAMIGVGGRGTGVLGCIDKSQGVKVVALCDINAGNLNRAAEMVSEDKPELFSDYEHMFDTVEMDAVFVETPCYLHAEMVLAALHRNVHCYAEKPMALTVKDCNAMLAASKKSKGIYQIGTQLRYGGPWAAAVDAIRKGRAGRPILVRAHRHSVGDYPKGSRWFFFREYSGDTICEQAVHEFDLFNWLFDSVPVRAAAFGGRDVHMDPPGRDTLDNYTLSLDYGDGRVSYSHSWISSPKTPYDGMQQVVYCEDAAVDIGNGRMYPKDGKPIKLTEESGIPNQAAVDDFFRCIREGDQPIANAEAGRNATLVSLLGLKALDTGRVVTWAELLKDG
jgi:predicted dehydrogenase